MVSCWRVSVDVPWDKLGVVAWLSCDCLSHVIVEIECCGRRGWLGFDSCYPCGVMRFWLGLWGWLLDLSVLV